MQPSIRNNYLETEVMTATPQKLQYMLIDAAIRNLQRGKHLRSENQYEAACEAIIRTQKIVTQILTGLDHEVGGDLTRKVAAIYMFIFRSLNEAQLHRDDTKLDECIGVLEIERDTWRQLCEQLDREQPASSEAAQMTISNEPAPPTPEAAGPPAPTMPFLDLSADLAGGGGASTGFSIEA